MNESTSAMFYRTQFSVDSSASSNFGGGVGAFNPQGGVGSTYLPGPSAMNRRRKSLVNLYAAGGGAATGMWQGLLKINLQPILISTLDCIDYVYD